jgi:NitT/TauT family transport system permease protein
MSAGRNERLLRVLLPALVLGGVVLGWEVLVRVAQVPHYILPSPSRILATLFENFDSLAVAWWFTIKITFGALLLAAAGGVLLATVFALSRTVERALFPLAIALQVTPIVAIAPLILIYVESTTAALLICAWIVAFFPILSNTVIGLRAADPNLRDLFTLYRGSRWQRLRWLLVPTALPYFIAGLKISGGLALIGAVVAEFAAGARRAWHRASSRQAFAPTSRACTLRCCWWRSRVLRSFSCSTCCRAGCSGAGMRVRGVIRDP